MATGETSQAQLEIASSTPILANLLQLLNDPNSSVKDIKAEIIQMKTIEASIVVDYAVPASGLTVMFYVARRLANLAGKSETSSSDSIDLFRTLIRDCGADVNRLDTVMGQNVLFYAAKVGDIDCCKYLLSEGCRSNHMDIHNQTPVFYAAREGKTETVEWLVGAGGCDINQLDRNGQTPLFYAAKEDRFECVMTMVNSLGADPLIRDNYKKRARSYLKSTSQKRTYDFLTEVERARDPSAHASHRKLFVVRNEPVGAAAMTLRQHKPYNPYQQEATLEESAPPAPPPAKRQKSAPVTPSAAPVSKPPSVKPVKSERTSVAPSPIQSPAPEPALAIAGRSRFRVRAPLGRGGLEAFEKEFPQFALWTPTGTHPSPSPSTPPKALNRPARAPPVSVTPPWISVVSLLLRGPLWRYGPATIFHKPVLQLPSLLGPKYQEQPGAPERKLTIDLSVVRKKLEKGKYQKMGEVDKDIRTMFEQAYSLSGGPDTNIGLLTKATEIYYDQQIAGCGLAGVIRQERDDVSTHQSQPDVSDLGIQN